MSRGTSLDLTLRSSVVDTTFASTDFVTDKTVAAPVDLTLGTDDLTTSLSDAFSDPTGRLLSEIGSENVPFGSPASPAAYADFGIVDGESNFTFGDPTPDVPTLSTMGWHPIQWAQSMLARKEVLQIFGRIEYELRKKDGGKPAVADLRRLYEIAQEFPGAFGEFEVHSLTDRAHNYFEAYALLLLLQNRGSAHAEEAVRLIHESQNYPQKVINSTLLVELLTNFYRGDVTGSARRDLFELLSLPVAFSSGLIKALLKAAGNAADRGNGNTLARLVSLAFYSNETFRNRLLEMLMLPGNSGTAKRFAGIIAGDFKEKPDNATALVELARHDGNTLSFLRMVVEADPLALRGSLTTLFTTGEQTPFTDWARRMDDEVIVGGIVGDDTGYSITDSEGMAFLDRIVNIAEGDSELALRASFAVATLAFAQEEGPAVEAARRLNSPSLLKAIAEEPWRTPAPAYEPTPLLNTIKTLSRHGNEAVRNAAIGRMISDDRETLLAIVSESQTDSAAIDLLVAAGRKYPKQLLDQMLLLPREPYAVWGAIEILMREVGEPFTQALKEAVAEGNAEALQWLLMGIDVQSATSGTHPDTNGINIDSLTAQARAGSWSAFYSLVLLLDPKYGNDNVVNFFLNRDQSMTPPMVANATMGLVRDKAPVSELFEIWLTVDPGTFIPVLVNAAEQLGNGEAVEILAEVHNAHPDIVPESVIRQIDTAQLKARKKEGDQHAENALQIIDLARR